MLHAVNRQGDREVEKANPQDTLVPDGDYHVAYRGYEAGNVYDRIVLFVRCEIVEGPHQGLVLPRYYNQPRPDRPLARSHSLAKDYMRLAGRRPPKRLKPDQLLKGCIVLARAVTVRELREGKVPTLLPEAAWHSKIDAFLKLLAGTPPCMRSEGA